MQLNPPRVSVPQWFFRYSRHAVSASEESSVSTSEESPVLTFWSCCSQAHSKSVTEYHVSGDSGTSSVMTALKSKKPRARRYFAFLSFGHTSGDPVDGHLHHDVY